MRLLLVCGFLVVGLPNLFGFVFGACARIALLCANPLGNANLRVALSEIIGGFVIAFAAVLVANLLNLHSSAWLTLMAALWFAIHFIRVAGMPQLIRSCIGILCGWYAYSVFLSRILG